MQKYLERNRKIKRKRQGIKEKKKEGGLFDNLLVCECARLR
jgi:hypothetical protein